MTGHEAAYADIPGTGALESARRELIADIGYADEETERIYEKSNNKMI